MSQFASKRYRTPLAQVLVSVTRDTTPDRARIRCLVPVWSVFYTPQGLTLSADTEGDCEYVTALQAATAAYEAAYVKRPHPLRSTNAGLLAFLERETQLPLSFLKTCTLRFSITVRGQARALPLRLLKNPQDFAAVIETAFTTRPSTRA